MNPIIYRPADVLHWFDTDAKRSSDIAKSKSKNVAKKASEEGIIPSLKEAAGAALSFGRGAVGGIIQRAAEETRYELHENGFEVIDLTKKLKIDYSQIRQIISKPNDRFHLLYNGGSLTIKPVAHLVAGRYRAPVGWMRNGMEVPYAMLIEELAARSSRDIEAE
ncbi:MAG: hypothetical protein LCH41_04000 [Armatimonadetes bacterium]|jgi:hypothetical protein|nr:hypothetical protein [Armatimonadota bacterium]